MFEVKPVNIMDSLRAQTADVHELIEKLPFSQALVTQNLPLPLYVSFLSAMLSIHRALEQQCLVQNHPAIQKVWQDDLIKTTLLEKDLAYFAQKKVVGIPFTSEIITQFIHYIEETGQQQPVALLGLLYVLEGSTLGAQFLLSGVQSAYALQEEGVHYYQNYGEETRAHWLHFKRRMNATVTDPADQNQVIESAKQTFDYIKLLLEQFDPTRSV